MSALSRKRFFPQNVNRESHAIKICAYQLGHSPHLSLLKKMVAIFTKRIWQPQPRHKWQRKKRNLAVDDAVLLYEEQVPAGTWPVGRVVEVYPDTHGRVRQVQVKTKNILLRRLSSNSAPFNCGVMKIKFCLVQL